MNVISNNTNSINNTNDISIIFNNIVSSIQDVYTTTYDIIDSYISNSNYNKIIVVERGIIIIITIIITIITTIITTIIIITIIL